MTSSSVHASPQSRLLAFIHHETTAGLLLVVAAVAAIAAYNIEDLRIYYDGMLQTKATVAIGDLGISKAVVLWINDGLMALFFFLVGLEIKREVLEGNLSSRDQIVLPALCAVGGMAAPAIVYSLFNWGDAKLMEGWAIPAATDIAFALGALSLAGSRVPPALKVFLLTLATLDDLGAIVIIALFYTTNLSVLSLAGAGAALVVLFHLNRMHVSRTAIYVLVGLAMWVFVLKSGVHATLAGVALALMIPLRRKDGTPFISALEEGLHPYVTFLILPLFAFANAGLPLDGFSAAKMGETLPLGIAAGLVVGKPLGILLAAVLAVLTGVAKLPERCNWLHIAGVGCLAGIGFTMSLFIGGLAFETPDMMAAVRVGVIAGSVVSTVLGIAVLMLAVRRQPA
jgi:NhaA family Na+:H+ antiporter